MTVLGTNPGQAPSPLSQAARWDATPPRTPSSMACAVNQPYAPPSPASISGLRHPSARNAAAQALPPAPIVARLADVHGLIARADRDIHDAMAGIKSAGWVISTLAAIGGGLGLVIVGVFVGWPIGGYVAAACWGGGVLPVVAMRTYVRESAKRSLALRDEVLALNDIAAAFAPYKDEKNIVLNNPEPSERSHVWAHAQSVVDKVRFGHSLAHDFFRTGLYTTCVEAVTAIIAVFFVCLAGCLGGGSRREAHHERMGGYPGYYYGAGLGYGAYGYNNYGSSYGASACCGCDADDSVDLTQVTQIHENAAQAELNPEMQQQFVGWKRRFGQQA